MKAKEKGMGKGYSLWLLPDHETYERLWQEINRISLIHNTPTFEPHVTLLNGIEGRMEELVDRAGKVAESIKPIKMKFSGIGYSDEYFKSFYINVKKTENLEKARRIATKIFRRKDGGAPHMSLAYGELPRKTKEYLKRNANRSYNGEFTAKRLSLYSTKGRVGGWFKVADFYLK